MKLAEGENSIACYPAAAPPGRGIQATLTSHRLVWSDGEQEEHYPLERIGGVTHGFQRTTRSVFWAVVMLVLAAGLGAGLLWAQANLPALADSMVQTLGAGENPERVAAAHRAYQQRVDALMLLAMPLWGVAGALLAYAAWRLYTGIRGVTRVQVTLLPATRTLARRGRDPQLLEFGEQVARRAAGLSAGAKPPPVAEDKFVDWIPARTGRH
jgi:hypothetical protein